ncbi:MAG TPA: hypothetical protein VFH27_17455 [Longimicrobiaceae bacterium]|nr:hypothetical protein [Longimicrobiaceae bacterium]
MDRNNQDAMQGSGPRQGGNLSDDRTGTTSNETGRNRPSDVDRMQGRPASGSWGEEGLGNPQRDEGETQELDSGGRSRT